jgi:TonB family protein
MKLRNQITMALIGLAVLFINSSRVTAVYLFYLLPPLQETKWAGYRAWGEEFRIQLPEEPAISTKYRPDKKPSSRYLGRIYAAYGEGTVYVIISENNPKRAEKLETFVEEFKKQLPRWQSDGKTYSSEKTFDRELNLNGILGKRYRIRIYDRADGIVDFYITNHHVYIVEAVSYDLSHPSIQRFFNSFTLDEKLLDQRESKENKNNSPQNMVSQVPQSAFNQADDNQVFTSKEVDQRVVFVSRPEPGHTEEARHSQTTGTVVMRAVLSASGKVTSIKIVKGLKDGLTEKAIEAAIKMKFIPAVKDGKFVS